MTTKPRPKKETATPAATPATPTPDERLLGSRSPTRLEKFRDMVLTPEKRAELWQALPAHVKPAVFERNFYNALMQNTELMAMPPELLFREIAKAAALGLVLDPQLGEGYVIIVWNGKANRKEPQFRIGYRGMIKLTRQSGDVVGIYAREVYSKDKFTIKQGIEEDIVHEPMIFGDRGEIAGYYGVIKFKDGSFDFEPMSVMQCRAVRDRSDGWKAFQAHRIASTPWATDESEMSKKTVLRRLLKRQPQSPERMMSVLAEEDIAEFAREPSPVPLSPIRDRLVGAIGQGDGMQHHVGDDVDEALKAARAVTMIDDDTIEHSEIKAAHHDDTVAPEGPTVVAERGPVTSTAPATGTDEQHQQQASVPTNSTASEVSAQTVSSDSSIKETVRAAPGNGPPGAATNPLAIARQRGIEARRKGFKERAVPPEYRERGRTAEVAAYLAGWRDEDDNQRGSKK